METILLYVYVKNLTLVCVNAASVDARQPSTAVISVLPAGMSSSSFSLPCSYAFLSMNEQQDSGT